MYSSADIPKDLVICRDIYGRIHGHSLVYWIIKKAYYRQVPRKHRLACPVKYEVYLTGVGGDESAQLKNNKIISGMPRAVRGEHHITTSFMEF